MYYNVTLRRIRVTNVITHSECVFVAIVMQHALRLRRVVLSCVAYSFVSLF